MSFGQKQPKIPEPQKAVAFPDLAGAAVKKAQQDAMKALQKRAGRTSTLLSGRIGDGIAATPSSTRTTTVVRGSGGPVGAMRPLMSGRG
jgi:hypothetical protein